MTPTDDLIRSTLQSVRTIAVVGASNKLHRASHGVMRFLQARGYRCIPVNPSLAGQSLLDETVHADLRSIAGPVDMVDVFRNSADAGPVVDEAIAIGAKVVWMQLGVINPEAAERGCAAGLTVIMDRCPAIEIPRLGL
ncbi:MAG: CoA-binding protein [Gammaproteobacteria bacterium]